MAKGARKAGRVTAETARRITGISLPIGGIQWADPGPSERARVRDFLLALEDRRALYNPMQLEVRGDVEWSLRELRKDCTTALRSLDEGAFAVAAVRAIREACRRFHDDAQLQFRLFYHHDGGSKRMPGSSWRSAPCGPRSGSRSPCSPPTTTSMSRAI
ncbi:DUF6650 family protein [Methylorubrum aminovorans]|uniref:DUF6650 family protein n=1 Tax=Methylorubrum aminovorans TaxID=269069 RepID=UPI0024E098C1|nr:DUF6650 family protein [Methylorubrum aminovorans]